MTHEAADTTPPEFVILHPSNQQHFETESVVFEGEVDPGARVFAGEYEANVDDHGNWRIVLILDVGQNVATLEARDAAGNTSTDTVTIHYDIPKQDPADGGGKDEAGDGGIHEEPPAEQLPKAKAPPEEPPAEEPEGGGEESASVEFTANQRYGSRSEGIPF